ncbi:hypothetical protein NECAME_16957 [Necator americanus]|uniref:Uncharacterized protein n=1 Tax=Necator americanus TaxID=51031 RepID=W2TTN9_NECAM|nr:hypothetical protein NECAME_16957 [Necator americanus]ETN85019.1 hypothetical protein NECAME_16957 [Necator americanus]
MPANRVGGCTGKGILESAKGTKGARGRLQLPDVTRCGLRRKLQLRQIHMNPPLFAGTRLSSHIGRLSNTVTTVQRGTLMAGQKHQNSGTKSAIIKNGSVMCNN